MLRETRKRSKGLTWKPLLVLGVFVSVLLWSGWRAWDVRRYRKAMAEIDEAMDLGRNGLAARDLVALLSWKPNSDEARYLLGVCEASRQRTREADEAWSRIPPGSEFAPRAILGRMQLQMDRGRLAEAEQIIRDALDDPRIDGSSLPILLGPIYCQQGRVEETLGLIETRWEVLNQADAGATEPAIDLIRAHIDLCLNPIPLEAIRTAIDHAAQLAPDDDRVWLGKANLSLRLRSYDETEHWLDSCLRRRPDDVPVWSARLSWALATSRVDEVKKTLEHLPAEESTPAQVRSLVAWLAAKRGDAQTEARALQRLITVDPANVAALDRLAELEVREGKLTDVSELRRKRTEIDRLQARYRELYLRNQPARDAAEMARLANQLGQWFEAKAFLTVAVAVDSDRVEFRNDLARLKPAAGVRVEPGPTLAEAVAAERSATEAGPE